MNKRRTRGPGKRFVAASLTPTDCQIAWAAGIFEGEGSIGRTNRSKGVGSLSVAVVQKDPWLLYELQRLFGGTIGDIRKDGCRSWYLFAERADSFINHIYPYLSPRRREQVVKYSYVLR